MTEQNHIIGSTGREMPKKYGISLDWVSVNARLPENPGTVRVCHTIRDDAQSCWLIKASLCNWSGDAFEVDGWVTHWASALVPVPPLPKEYDEDL